MTALDPEQLADLATEFIHCGKPMKFVNSRTLWEGQPGGGHQIDRSTRRCQTCTATLHTRLRAPN